MKRALSAILLTAALLALCACGAAVPAVLAEDVPAESAVPSPADTPEPTDAPTPAPPVPTETPTPSPEPTPEPPLPSWEILQRTLYESNDFCAALYLGRSSAPLADALPELLAQNGLDGMAYLTGIESADCVEQYGDEVFILIPRGDRSVSIYAYVLENRGNYGAYAGALLYSSDSGRPIAVRCNDSDVRPNLLAVFTGADGDEQFSPRITLGDALLAAPGVYALPAAE